MLKKLCSTLFLAIVLIAIPVSAQDWVWAPWSPSVGQTDQAQSVEDSGLDKQAVLSSTTQSCGWEYPGCGYDPGFGYGQYCSNPQYGERTAGGEPGVPGTTYQLYGCCSATFCTTMSVPYGGDKPNRYHCAAGSNPLNCDATESGDCWDRWNPSMGRWDRYCNP